MTVNLTFRTAPSWFRRLAQQTAEAADGAAWELAQELADRTRQQLDAQGRNDTGELRSSVDVVNVSGGYEVRVDAPHAAPIEYGTRPYRPPSAPLAAWARRRGLANDDRSALAIAFGIIRRVEVEGFRPKPYFRPAVAETLIRAPGIIVRELVRRTPWRRR